MPDEWWNVAEWRIEMQMIMAQGLADRKIEDVVAATACGFLTEAIALRSRVGRWARVRAAVGQALITMGKRVAGARREIAPPLAARP